MRLNILQNPHHLLVHQLFGIGHRDIEQNVAGSGNQVVIQQGRMQRRFGHRLGPVVAFGRRYAHVRAAAVPHHLRHVGEIDVHQVALDRNDLGDTLRSRSQDVVGLAESLLQGQTAVYFKNILVVDNQQRIDVLTQLLDAPERLFVTDLTFDGQRRSDDADGQHSHLLGQLGDHRRSARTRTAAHAGSDEDHLGPRRLETLAHHIERLDGGLAAVFRVVAGTQSLAAEPDFQFHGTLVECLLVCIADHKVHALDPQVPHVIHGIAARTADTDYHDNGRIRAGSGQLGHYIICHIVSFLLS